MTFAALGLAPELLKAVSEQGYENPTPIQAAAIPVVLAGQDVLGAAQTGTGKTAAFTLPILQRLLRHASTSVSPAKHPIRALVLTPTRELADQVHDSVTQYAKYSNLRNHVVYGGVDIKGQIPALRSGVEILVATPGRLLDHIEQKTVNLSQVEILVLDEADRMLDMGFILDIRRIFNLCRARKQTLLFSATFAPEIKKLADDFMKSPQLVQVERQNSTNESVKQELHPVETGRKRALLAHLIRLHDMAQVIVFTRTKQNADQLSRDLKRDGFAVEAIHGDRDQRARMETLAGFKEGRVKVLVATDVAARGLDISDLPFVVNFELPNNPEDYVHRIGRTGRAGATGVAISLVAPEEEKAFDQIKKLIKKELALIPVPGFSPGTEPLYSPRREERGERGARGERGSSRERDGQRREGVPERAPRRERDADPLAGVVFPSNLPPLPKRPQKQIAALFLPPRPPLPQGE
ncbi:DEAD/DEAH box helicase [Chitinilyticum piscinae]|uniref:DEAD-box ATP-dependent RNA helicase RhpA n=1 Tax=Chitinilyticum piscinae TaxID=2866724 RepID=A0A8J7FLT9_9NEIS|nr:DEAD/DEAH box helicase [Chitinilyticum piscinae]MBE9610257.1 DEAD/DEAH box helicase [Chitinilyticum piscinae]